MNLPDAHPAMIQHLMTILSFILFADATGHEVMVIWDGVHSVSFILHLKERNETNLESAELDFQLTGNQRA